MPKKSAVHNEVDSSDGVNVDEFEEDEPLPVKRDTRIFHRKKEDDTKDDDFEEDVFV